VRRWIQALALRLDPGWRRRPGDERRRDAACFADAVRAAPGTTHCYATVGLEAGADVLLWRLAPGLDELQAGTAAVRGTGLGRWLEHTTSFVGEVRPSPYARRPQPAVPALFDGERRRYLIVYPFTKTAGWYALGAEERRTMMTEHMRLGHSHPEVRQLLASSFGVDDQDFVVAYGTDDPARFSDLVRDLRATRARAYTACDTPLLIGVRRSVTEVGGVLGG
jgi:chlorite dismutase